MTHVTAEAAAAPLDRARAEVGPVLREAVGTLPPRLRAIAAYHFGWEDAEGGPDSQPGGKSVRPAMALAAAKAVRLDPGPSGSGPEEERRTCARRRAAAAAVELAHNFTLLHDDVIDRDQTRRHRATAWTVFGAENAILAGDALLALALRIATEAAGTGAGADSGSAARATHAAAPVSTARAADTMAARLAEAVAEVCEGQYDDLAFEQRDTVSLAECLAMAEKKTGALLGAACAMGALAAGAPPEAVDAMDRYGRQVGLAFQLVDDLLGIWGEPAVTGKPAGADLAARKKSLPVVAALASRSRSAAELAKLYGSGSGRDLTDAELRRAADAVDRAGGRAWAQAEAERRVAAARAHIAEHVDEAAAADLYAIADLVAQRSH